MGEKGGQLEGDTSLSYNIFLGGKSLPKYMQKGKIPYPEQEKQYLYIAKKPLRKH